MVDALDEKPPKDGGEFWIEVEILAQLYPQKETKIGNLIYHPSLTLVLTIWHLLTRKNDFLTRSATHRAIRNSTNALLAQLSAFVY